MNRLLLILFLSVLLNIGIFAQNNSPVQDGQIENNTKYTPGLKLGGISIDESEFQEMPTEKCQGETIATIIKSYSLTKDLYLIKTEKGFGIAEIDLSFRDLETGVRRSSRSEKASCKITKGLVIKGEIDCKGARLIKKEPYDNCAYDIKVWAHSMTEVDAIDLIAKMLQLQFLDYRKTCVIAPKSKSIQDRMMF